MRRGGDRVTLVRARRIYAVDGDFSTHECMAVREGRVLALGDFASLSERHPGARVMDYGNACVYPGFYDPHSHFLSYGIMLGRVDLSGTASWEEAVERLSERRAQAAAEPWILGRAWDQNRWQGGAFPTRELLDRAIPDRPALAIRIDGHAGIANSHALALAGLGDGSEVPGGRLLRDGGGRLTGLVMDGALEAVKAIIPVPDDAARHRAVLEAQARCLAAGLTSVSNAGTDAADARFLREVSRSGELKVGMYAMLRPEKMDEGVFSAKEPVLEGRFTARSFKMFADGALGSRGAWLLAPYADDPGNRGLPTLEPGALRAACAAAKARGFQMNVHAIGDASARMVLDIFQEFLEPGNDLRWRIEHAQIVDPGDMPRFGRLGVIPSVQASHATADMGWIQERLGSGRMQHAHPYRELLAQNGWLANGSDFPFERIEPIFGFHAAVARKDAAGLPPGGFQPENALAREQALRAMTAWAARANFEEGDRGSLEAGKSADYVALSEDLMTAPEKSLRGIRVEATVIAGETLHGG